MDLCRPARPARILAERSPIRALPQRAVAQFGRAPVSKTGGWGFESLRPCRGRKKMNRQVKRAMQRRQQSPERLQVARRQQLEAKKRKRVGPRQFLREVRGELRKVAWPGRREMVAYTLVVLFTVIVLTAYVFGVDFLVGKGVLWVFGRGN